MKVDMGYFLLQLTIAGKPDKTSSGYPEELAIGVFNTLGISAGEKLNKEQFINGYNIFLFLK